jgi:MFS transporter, FHS family, L-fucose permease
MALNIPHSATDDAVPPSQVSGSKNPYLAPLSVLTTLFFAWGFITCLNDIIIPHLKAVFDLNYAQAMMVQLAFFTAYFVASLPSGAIIERIGHKRGIIVGLLVSGAGCALFYPAADLRSYPMFLGALFMLACGITLLQVAANPFVAVLGPSETASSRLTLTQALNSFGTFLAPFFGSALILANAVKSADELKTMSPDAVATYRLAEAASVQKPYVGLALALMALAVMIALSKLPNVQKTTAGGTRATDANATEYPQNAVATHAPESAWGYRHLVLGAVAIFLYVGGEVAIGSFLVNYLKEPIIAGLTEQVAAKYVALYWGGAMVGRFVGTVTLRTLQPRKVLTAHAIGACLLVMATMSFSGPVAMWTVLSIGLFNSIMFPTIFTLAIEGLGKHTNQGSGILCMAIVGGAVVPVVQGALADMPSIGLHHCFIIPLLCYAYIGWYGLKGSRASNTQVGLA